MTEKSGQPEFRFGQGKISGVLSVTLGAMAFGGVLCLLFPSLLTTPRLREVLPMPLVRWLIQFVLAASFVLGALSVVLSKKKTLGAIGIFVSVAATLMGGAQVRIDSPVRDSPYIGLDWFILNLLVLALIFVPMERLFARVKDQPIFRTGWKTDVVHFGVSHVLVQVTVLLTMVPAAVFFHWAVSDEFQKRLASQPLVLQFVGALFLADLFAYVAHRLFHVVPFLWRFHQIHHSSQCLDWLASSRLHIVDIVVTRAFGFIPLYILGFSNTAIYAYLLWASMQAIFIHANVRFKFGPLRWVLATPQFHHWHHTAEKKALDKNFAVHLPVIDMVFGTYYLPKDEWPKVYGIEGNPVPEGYVRQLVYPVTVKKLARESTADSE